MEQSAGRRGLAVRTGRWSRRAATAIVRLRWLILAVWLGGAAASYILLQGPSALPTSSLYALIPRDTQAFHALDLEQRLFSTSILPQIAVVQHAEPLTASQQATILRTAVHLDQGRLQGYPPGAVAIPVINDVPFLPGTRETATTAVTYMGFPSKIPFARQRVLAERYAAMLSRQGPPAAATGLVAGGFQESATINSHLDRVEIASIVVVLAIVGIYLRSVLAPLVTLFAAAVVYLLTSRAVTYLAERTGIQLHRETEPIVAVLLLGVITDYSVFFLSGMRDRILAGQDRVEAARETAAQFLPIVLTAGLLVSAGLATLQVASVGFVQALGPGLALVVFITLLVALTFTPAAMALLGQATFWPGIRGDVDPEGADEERRGHALRLRLARLLSRRGPATAAAVGSFLLLGLGASGLLHIRLGLTIIRGLPGGSAPHHAADQAARGFAAGIVAPTELIVRQPHIRAQPEALLELGRRIEQVPGVAVAFGAGLPPLLPGTSVFRSSGGGAARYLVVLRDTPFSARAISELSQLQHAMPRLLRESGLGGAKVAYAGDTAIAHDTVRRIEHDLWLVGLSVFAVNFLLLALYLRALLAPLYLLFASGLAIAATFGLTTYLFQGLLGYGEITYYIPLAAGVLLVAFGSDYNLFVIGRIWQEARAHSPTRALVAAVPRASRAITVAALALSFSFATLVLVPLRSFREFAFAISAGVLIDTTLVRTFLIPAFVTLTGRWSWWPSRPD